MRGLDTNLLVRYLTRDDRAQFALASRLFEGSEATGERLFINTITLCELVWTLRGRRYAFDREAIVSALEKLLATPLLEVQARDQVWEALAEYREGGADFADYLIGRENASAGCRDTVTFDTHLAGTPGFAVLIAKGS